MIDRDERVRSLITQEAADWFVANRAGLNPGERKSFTAWLKASPVHVEEYLGLATIARDLRQASAQLADSIDALLTRARSPEEAQVEPLWSRILSKLIDAPSRRWRTLAMALAAVAVVSLGLLVLWSARPTASVSVRGDVTALHFETRHGEQQTYRLADNSVLHLNTDTALTVRYSKRERLLTLISGEADFEVAHEPERPFRVFAGPAEVVDLGTRFDVRLGNQSTVVTVVEGRVAVGVFAPPEGSANPGHAAPFVQVGTDQQITVAEGMWPATPVVVDAQRTTAWLHRQITFENEPLERVASEFNRYTSKQIEITSPELRSMKISGVFATDNSAAFIAFLRSLEGVRVDVTATRIIVSQK